MIGDIFNPNSSFVDRCMGCMMLLATLLVVVLVGLLGYLIVDSVGITSTKSVVTVVEVKQVVPAYTSFIMAGKVLIPQYHPESYRLHFKIYREEVVFTVEKNFFDSINIGDRVEVDYGLGRLSNSYQPTSIRLAGG